MAGEEYLWPLNPASVTPAKQIDWIQVPASTMEKVQRPTIRKVHREYLVQLKNRFGHLWDSMDAGCQEAALAIIEARPENKNREAPGKKSDPKTKIKDMIAGVMEDAEAEGDISTKLNAIKLLADVEALLRQKPELEDNSLASKMLAARKRINGQ